MTKRYLGNIITQNPTAPAGNLQGSAAKGVWSLEEQLAYQKAGLWPVPGNFVDITDVFSTYLYEGNGSTQTITNGIDLDGEGGLVWIKQRNAAVEHFLFDTDRGATKSLSSNDTTSEYTSSTTLTSFNSSGFTLSSSNFVNGTPSRDYASWTFRKAPKFFDVVTYTGNGGNLTIDHNLGSVPGCIIIKCTSAVKSWVVYHRGVNGGSNPENYALFLNSTGAQNDNLYFQDTAPTSTQFFLGDSAANENGQTHVAYLFAHNDGDGGFGPDGSDIIKCGSYTGNGSTTGPVIDLGFEPQWLLVKNTSAARPWIMLDTMRGTTVGTSNAGSDEFLLANASDAEDTDAYLSINSTGFQLRDIGGNVNASNENYIYIAIRRGPLAQPKSGTEVFAVQAQAGGYQVNRFASSGFPVDFVLDKEYDDPSNWLAYDRLRGGKADLRTNLTNAESINSPAPIGFDYNDGITEGFYNSANNVILPMWKRAPGFCDVVAYTGDGTAGRTVSHNLGVAPELIVTKRRESSMSWAVGVPSISSGQGYLKLQSSDALDIPFYTVWSNITASSYNVGADGITNASGATYISYLFATVPGVSKVGSYTGNGTSQTIDCGFTSGARFVLIKRTDSSGDWYVWDTERGIVAGNDPHLSLNTTAAQVTSDDSIDPASSGFIVNQVSATDVNVSSATYIFYAIA